MIKLGITGGIGSGKTTVCKIFEQLGVAVYYADDEAKKIAAISEIQAQIIKAFGKNICSENDKIDNKKLAEIVFNDANELKKLNEIIHPAVASHFLNWCAKQKGKYIIKEAAILFESETYKQMDYVATVISPQQDRINRVMQRDKVSEESILQRIKNQLSDEEKIKFSQFVIQNNNSEMLLPQVLNIHNTLTTLKK